MNTETFILWLKDLPPAGVYLFMAVSSIIENIFPPWPGDTVTVFGGFLAANGVISPVICFIFILAGNLIGANIMYFAGNKILFQARKLHAGIKGDGIFKKMLFELTEDEKLRKTHVWFEKWGVLFVLVSRFSAGIRFFVSIIAGISGMNYLVFSVCFSIGVFFWNVLLLGGGYLLGHEWHRALEWLRVYNMLVIVIIAAGVAAYVAYRIIKKRKTDGQP